MKVCLIVPLETHNMNLSKLLFPEIFEPIGLTYLGSVLRGSGHETCIIDRRILVWSNGYNLSKADKATVNIIKRLEPDIIGFHIPTVMLNDVRYLLPNIKEICPAAKIVLGGPHPTLAPTETLMLIPQADVVVRGEGEITILDLVNNVPYEKILGITYKKMGKIFSNKDRPLIQNLDDLPLPARDLIDMDFYMNKRKNVVVDYGKSYQGEQPKMAEIIASRGCVSNCAFCASPTLWRRRVRFHSPNRIIKELWDLLSYGANYVYFNDDTFTLNRRWVNHLCELLIKEKLHEQIQWVCQSRPERVSVQMLSIMKKAGCVRIEYGFESGSQRILDLMNKKTNLNKYYTTVRITKKVGLNFQANIIMGYPGETEEDIRDTIIFLKKIDAPSVLLNAFWPLPGASIYQQLKSDGYQLDCNFMPAHPFLMSYNFTAMSDERLNDMFWELINFAPEALEYLRNNKELFKTVSADFGAIFTFPE